ncbi:MAG: thioesterase superfamily protein, partial [Ramlibacter sp.]|nr:thioesterase superfamily protein [Ramlibacter sp.]
MQFGVNIPFVHHLGFELQKFDDGLSEIHFEPKAEHLNSFNVVHGGACM